MALPTRGQRDWDDELNNEIQRLDSDVQSAVANASSAKSTAISAQTSADDAAASAARSATAAETAASAATAPTDETMAAKVNDSTSQTHAALSATFAGPGLSVASYGVIGDSATDDTTALQAALDAAATDGFVPLVPRDFTCVTDTLTVPDGITLRIDGTLLKKPGTTGAVLHNVGPSAGITIFGNGVIDGNKANQTTYADAVGLLDFTAADDLTIDGLRITGNYLPTASPAADTLGALYVKNSSRAVVRNVTVDDYAREAIWLENCTDSTVAGCTTRGGVDSWSGLQISGTRNTVINFASHDAGATGISVDSTHSLLIGCLVTNNVYYHGYNFGHDGLPASFTTAVGCVYDLDAGVNLTDLGTSAANGFNIAAGSDSVQLVGCTSDGAKKHGINVSDTSTRARVTGCRAVNSGQYGLSVFEGQVTGGDLDLNGNTSGATSFSGTGVTYYLTNVRTSASSVTSVMGSAVNIAGPNGTAELGNLTIRGNTLVAPTNLTDYRDFAVARQSGANVFKVVFGIAGSTPFILGHRDDIEFARLSLDHARGAVVSTMPVAVQAAATDSRPSATTVGAGAHMFDTTLGKPIWSNGTTWVDATGTAV